LKHNGCSDIKSLTPIPPLSTTLQPALNSHGFDTDIGSLGQLSDGHWFDGPISLFLTRTTERNEDVAKNWHCNFVRLPALCVATISFAGCNEPREGQVSLHTVSSFIER